MKKMLSAAVQNAYITICGGYEIDTIGFDQDLIRMEFSDDDEWSFKDQEIDISPDGSAKATDVDGEVITLEFKVLRPLSEADFA